MTTPIEEDIATWLYMPWVDAYAMQNKRLTKEHRQLVFLTNLIQHLLDTEQESVAREVFVEKFSPVARRHLRYEILVMNAIDFKGIDTDAYVSHCLAHANLEEGIDDICARITDTDMSEVSSFLKNWLETHIKKEDAAYNAEIVKLGITNG